jgi:hypothetical protein
VGPAGAALAGRAPHHPDGYNAAMRNQLHVVLAGLLAAAVVSPRPATAEATVVLKLGLPQAPRLVVIQPGIQVVEDFDDEVFFHSGVYWARRDGRWYRASGPHAEYRFVEERHVPEGLRRLPPGHYRHWKHESKKEERREERHEEHGHR